MNNRAFIKIAHNCFAVGFFMRQKSTKTRLEAFVVAKMSRVLSPLPLWKRERKKWKGIVKDERRREEIKCMGVLGVAGLGVSGPTPRPATPGDLPVCSCFC